MKTTTQLKEAMDLLQTTKGMLGNAACLCKTRCPEIAAMLEARADRIHAFQRRWSKSRKQPQ